MTPIKKIAGEILLYFYWLQRQDVSRLSDVILSFQLRQFAQTKKEEGPELQGRETSILDIEELKQYSSGDLYNAMTYLYERGLIDFTESLTNISSHFHNIRVTAAGVDIIEGIERGPSEKNHFNVTFNFNLNNSITVESLLKAELGSIIKASLT